MALPQIVTKTYSRRRSQQSDVSHAERTFDSVIRGDSRPPARAAATSQKWGTTSYKRVGNAGRTSPKRRLSPTHDGDDPFSFDSDDDNVTKKLKRGNIRQKTSSGGGETKPTAGMGDGQYVEHGAKIREMQRTKVSVSESPVKQSADKTRGHVSTKSTLKSVDSEKNGLSYCMAAVRKSGRTDFLEMRNANCRSNGIETDGGVSPGKKLCSNGSGRESSPCKTAQQLRVFVDNFSQLLSSAGRRFQPSSDSASGKTSPDIVEDVSPPACKSQSAENYRNDVKLKSVSHVAQKNRQNVRSAKVESGLSSALPRNSKRMNLNSSDDVANDDDDDDEVIFLSLKPSMPKPVSSPIKTVNAVSGTDPSLSSKSRNSPPGKTFSRESSNRGSKKSEVVDSKVCQLRSHRRRNSDNECDSEPAVTATDVATNASAATSTRRLLTASRKVCFFVLTSVFQPFFDHYPKSHPTLGLHHHLTPSQSRKNDMFHRNAHILRLHTQHTVSL